jgi:DNA polymerase I-like protein with 3'-5' exonuclease and polymerase domains
MPIAEVLEYNGLDTWHTMRLYLLFRDQLKQLPRTLRLFQHLMMPTVQALVHVERRGVYVHKEKLKKNWAIANENLAGIEKQLLEWVPEGELGHVNFNPSNFLRWWLFDHLNFPVLARGKSKEDGSSGDPSCAEAVMMSLAELESERLEDPLADPPHINIPALMLQRTEWYKMGSSFFGPYTAQADSNSRIHTTFKPWGTVTGRMSSGKEDHEKLTGRRQVRGVNLQQVPRDKLVRGVFGAPPGSSFVEADYSQIELRLAAFLAREPTMLRLYATGQDIHMAMAMRMTGKPQSAVTSEERKRAKAVNFGFLYGMGWAKFMMTAWTNYGLRVTESEARAFRTAFFSEFNKLPAWHAKQRRLANANGRVETPMGRIRHLPDIHSPDEGVRAEAERQAINSPVQALASDMALLSMVHVNKRFKSLGITGHPIGLVHDAVNYEVPNDQLTQALPIIKDTMENLPLRKLFGINLDVPIIADLKVGDSWGGATEIPADVLAIDSVSNVKLAEWLRNKDEVA